jgi:hypothetical protein
MQDAVHLHYYLLFLSEHYSAGKGKAINRTYIAVWFTADAFEKIKLERIVAKISPFFLACGAEIV